MNKYQERVCKAEVKPNCYVLVSATRKDKKETLGEYLVKANVSFFYDAGDVGAEWEPEFGPIQIWRRCEKDDDNAKEHYFYDYHNSESGNWSQMAVLTHELPQAFDRGDYNYIFSVLEDWAKDR